jgi:hypothetical protein
VVVARSYLVAVMRSVVLTFLLLGQVVGSSSLGDDVHDKNCTNAQFEEGDHDGTCALQQVATARARQDIMQHHVQQGKPGNPTAPVSTSATSAWVYPPEMLQRRALAVLVATKVLRMLGGDPLDSDSSSKVDVKKKLRTYVPSGRISCTTLADAWIESEALLSEVLEEFKVDLGFKVRKDGQFMEEIGSETDLDVTILISQ